MVFSFTLSTLQHDFAYLYIWGHSKSRPQIAPSGGQHEIQGVGSGWRRNDNLTRCGNSADNSANLS